MEEDKKKSISWKACIILGLINIVLVFLCTKLSIILISAGLAVLIVFGVIASFESFKEEWSSENKGSAILCGIGLLINAGAGVLYAMNILSGIINKFVH